MRVILFSALLLVFVSLANAQVKTNFNNREQITARGKFSKDFRGKSPYIIPARDIRALLQKEALENASGEAKPFKIAEAVPVDIDVINEAEWIDEGGIAYAKFSIVAAGAKSISVNFDQFYLTEGTELFVYSENGEMITGPITEEKTMKTIFGEAGGDFNILYLLTANHYFDGNVANLEIYVSSMERHVQHSAYTRGGLTGVFHVNQRQLA